MLRLRTPDGGVRDIEMGPANALHSRGPVSGGLVQPAPPIPSGRKGKTRGFARAEYQRLYQAARRERIKTTICGLPMPKAGGTCAKRSDHKDHCRSRYHLDNEMVSRSKRDCPR